MTAKEVLQLAKEYYAKDGNGVGGNLHIVLDDGNIKDHHVEFCIKRALDDGDTDGVTLGKEILKLSATQRKKLYLAGKD